MRAERGDAIQLMGHDHDRQSAAHHVPDALERLSRNRQSPTASTSSTISTSGLMWAAIANPRRAVHAARVALHGRIDELGQFRELDDVVEARRDLPRASCP